MQWTGSDLARTKGRCLDTRVKKCGKIGHYLIDFIFIFLFSSHVAHFFESVVLKRFLLLNKIKNL